MKYNRYKDLSVTRLQRSFWFSTVRPPALAARLLRKSSLSEDRNKTEYRSIYVRTVIMIMMMIMQLFDKNTNDEKYKNINDPLN